MYRNTLIKWNGARRFLLTGLILCSLVFSAAAVNEGKIAFTSNRDGITQIYVMDADGTNQTRLASNTDDRFPDWSPDGSKIVFTSGNTTASICITDGDGTNRTCLTGPAPCRNPVWSPDGSKIAYSKMAGSYQVYVMDRDGTNQTPITSDPGEKESGHAWSPDGSKIAYGNRLPGDNITIYVRKADGTGPFRRLTGNMTHSFHPAWSPDGSRIAHFSQVAGTTQGGIYVMGADGTGKKPLFISNSKAYDEPSWSPDASRIAFESGSLNGPDYNHSIYARTSDGTNQTRLTSGLWSDGDPDWGPLLGITAPDGGENWKQGSVQTIRWSFSGTSGSGVKIELLKAGAVNRVITQNTPAGSRSYRWRVPFNQTPGTDYQIRITSSGNPALPDTSFTHFTISAGSPITVTVPDGGRNWTQGSVNNVTWSYTGNPGSAVRIELLKGSAVNKVLTAGTSIGTGGSGSCRWRVPFNQAPGKDYKIRVTSTGNPAYNDSSNGNFTISAGLPITVTVPDGGQNWTQGSVQTIRWSYSGNFGSFVRIELLKGSVVNKVLTANTSTGTAGSGSYLWKVPYNQVPGSNYRIRITSTTTALYTDMGNADFSIAGGKPITVEVPDGGENWTRGSIRPIMWSYTGNPGSAVRIELIRGIKVDRVITAGTPIGSGGAGSYNWTIPLNQTLGADFKIRINSTGNAAFTDTSNANFTINDIDYIDPSTCRELFPGTTNATADRINVVFSGMLFTDKNDFISFAQNSVDYHNNLTGTGLLELEKYKDNKDKFNFWYIDKVLTPRSPAIISCTDCSSNKTGLYCTGLANRYDINFCNVDFRGCAYFGGASYIATNGSYGSNVPYVFDHEFQHQFPQLFDEYTESALGDRPGAPNCAPDLATAESWWGDLAGQIGSDGMTVGYYDGCSYVYGNYRATPDSIMRSWRFNLGLVNERHVSSDLSAFSGTPQKTPVHAVEVMLSGDPADPDSYTVTDIRPVLFKNPVKARKSNGSTLEINLKGAVHSQTFDTYEELVTEDFSTGTSIGLVEVKKIPQPVVVVIIETGIAAYNKDTGKFDIGVERGVPFTISIKKHDGTTKKVYAGE